MFLTLIFALIGLFFRGFGGLVVGALAGYVLSRILRTLVLRGLRSIQSGFLESTFAVVGAIAKADGVVTRDEILFAEELFERFHLTGEQRDAAKAAFNRGKAPDFNLDAEVERFAQIVRHNHALIQFFLMIQLRAVTADGVIHEKEQEIFVHIARKLGISQSEINQLEAMLRAAARGETGPSGPPPQQRVDDAYAVIGVASDASNDEVKRAYRKLMAEHHPDKLAAKGLPENMRELAEERARQINAAYDLIKKVRGVGQFRGGG